jgi:alpha-tubulin suppressor-like RCC1 family protein
MYTTAVDTTGLPSGVNITKVVAGYQSTFLLASSGKVYACGDNQNGVLGGMYDYYILHV